MVSHSKFDVVVKIEMAVKSVIYLKHSVKIKIKPSFFHKIQTKINTIKTEYTMKITSMLSAVNTIIPLCKNREKNNLP